MSAEKTLDILDLFDLDTRMLTVPQIAARLQQPVSSVYRHLRILREKGYLNETSNGYYKLGYRFLKMASIVRLDNSLSTVARPVMLDLTAQLEETSILSVRSQNSGVCIENVPAPAAFRVTALQGAIYPLYAGASGKSLLAFLPPAVQQNILRHITLIRHTENTIIDLDMLKENLAAIKKQGYAFSVEELDEGISAYGVPVYNSLGEVAASLSIAGPKKRLSEKPHAYWVENLQEASRKIQERL